MREYKTKETAIRNIRAGKMLYGKAFCNFQSDRDVCWEAIVHGRTKFAAVQRNIPGIEWDSDFVESAFTRMLEVNPRDICITEIGPYLTPKITESKDIAIRAAKCRLRDYLQYSAPELLLDEDVANAFRPIAYYRLHDEILNGTRVSQSSVQQLMGDTDLLEDLVQSCPDLYWSLPGSLRLNRKVSIAICVHTGSFRYALGNYHDNEKFVLEALLGYSKGRAGMFQTCSYRLRKAVGDNNPVEFLRRAILSNELQASLTHKNGDIRPKANRVKI
jgi:hypothetical protein